MERAGDEVLEEVLKLSRVRMNRGVLDYSDSLKR